MTKEEKTQPSEPLTAEEKLEEKRQQEEAQRSSDLQSAMELFGGMWSLLLGQCNPLIRTLISGQDTLIIRTTKQDTFK